MQLLLLALFCFTIVNAQVECGASPPVTVENMPAQKVAYVQIETPGRAPLSAVMKRGYDILVKFFQTEFKTSKVDFYFCNPTTCLNGVSLDTYTQVWVNDNSQGDMAATQIAGYSKIANWFTVTMQKPHLITDGRIRSSFWDGRTTAFGGAIPIRAGNRPNEALVKNYFVNLGIRGGGLFLGTDHSAWVDGINEINREIGISLFVNNFDGEPFALEADSRNNVLSYPVDAAEFVHAGKRYLWDDSSTADSPISEQRNGLIMFPIGWHGAIGTNRPGISTTIRGEVGFLIEITTPKCGQLFLPGVSVTFTARQTSGDAKVAEWSWSSNVDGDLGKGITINTNKLTPGQHIVTVRAVDTNRLVATSKVVIIILFSSGKAECIMTSRDGSQVREYFPVQRTPTAVAYYNYGPAGSPTAMARTIDNWERDRLTANFGLYKNNKDKISLIWVNSNNVAPATINIKIGISIQGGAPFTPTLDLVDDPNDRFIEWDSAKRVGFANFSFSGQTKGFIIGGVPDTDGSKWCLEVTVDVKSVTGLKSVNLWGHARDSDKYPSPERLGPTTEGAINTKVFQFCRISCSCAGVETRTAPSGTIEPVRVSVGGDGSIGQTYTGGVLCTWSIKPTMNGGVKRAGEEVEQAPSGITVWFDRKFDINPADWVSVYQGPQNGGLALVNRATGKVAPGTVNIQGGEATIAFTTTQAVKTEFGWIANYAVVPSLTAIAPNKGVLTEPTVVTLTGTFFSNSPEARVKITGIGPNNETLILPILKFISPTSIQVSIPGKVPDTVPVFYSNDARSGVYVGPVMYTWYDASCSAIKTCAGCAAKEQCAFCNDLNNPENSFCFGKGGDKTCPSDPKKFVADTNGCCTQCGPLKGCNGGGKCQCNDTCICDTKHVGKACECLQCPAGPNGKICSGSGTCNCNGTCTCNRGFREADCSCLTCEGEPTACSGRGSCNCNGTCNCNAGWTNSDPKKSICDCSTECPTGPNKQVCSGHGTCKCGVCDCDPEWASLDDCSCKGGCDPICNNNQVCNCDGTCSCKPGFKGVNCDEMDSCANMTDCRSCFSNPEKPDCVWCPEANVCENKFALEKCSATNRDTNPLKRQPFESIDQCPVADALEADVLSDNRGDLLIAALVGSLGVAAAALAAMAFFLRAAPVEALAGASSLDGAAMYHDSSIYVGANEGTNAAYV